MQNMKLLRFAPPVLALASLLLAGCGGSAADLLTVDPYVGTWAGPMNFPGGSAPYQISWTITKVSDLSATISGTETRGIGLNPYSDSGTITAGGLISVTSTISGANQATVDGQVSIDPISGDLTGTVTQTAGMAQNVTLDLTKQ